MSKKALIVALLGLNLAMAATLILSSWDPPAAFAQAAPLGQNYAIVAGEIRDGVDALYVLDLANRRMHVFLPNRDQNNRRMFHAGYRDLQRDFRGGQ
ncbi:MAG TPA: hypothetical protein VNT79_11520 [Phycisphaerae bacterium]|nr:hypothetical protein [Phycisphaerae bacterium]